eukprot:scaffold191981_cov19-Tisochrysis_lutea.AAC.1
MSMGPKERTVTTQSKGSETQRKPLDQMKACVHPLDTSGQQHTPRLSFTELECLTLALAYPMSKHHTDLLA